jgi:hypothetical protein
MKIGKSKISVKYSVIALCFAVPFNAYTNGILRNGIGAESMALGGTETGWADTPLAAMAANPAGLAFLDDPGADISLIAATPQGQFTKSPGVEGKLDSSLRAFPEGAIAYPFKKFPVTVGLSFIPESTMIGDWNYPDSPGGLGGVSYNQSEHRSMIELIRTALGAGGEDQSKMVLRRQRGAAL